MYFIIIYSVENILERKSKQNEKKTLCDESNCWRHYIPYSRNVNGIPINALFRY